MSNECECEDECKCNDVCKCKDKCQCKKKYFSISDAYSDVEYAYGAKDTAIAGLKMFGKGIFNIGKYAVTEMAPTMIKEIKDKQDKKNGS